MKAQRQHGIQQQQAQLIIQIECQQPAPRRKGIGALIRLPGRMIQPLRLRLRVKILFRIQGSILRAILPHALAQRLRIPGAALGVVPAPLALSQHSFQRALARLQRADGIDRYIQRPQQPHAPQRFHIGRRIIPIAVGLPLRGKQPLFLIKANVCARHAGLPFYLLDRHGYILLWIFAYHKA